MRVARILLVIAFSTLPVMVAHAGGYAHRPHVEYGSGYGHRGHDGHYRSPAYRHSGKHDDYGYALFGGLVLGAILGHALSRPAPHYVRRPYPEVTYWRDPPPHPNAPVYVPGRYQNRLLLDLDGNCYLVSAAESGGEVRSLRAVAECY